MTTSRAETPAARDATGDPVGARPAPPVHPEARLERPIPVRLLVVLALLGAVAPFATDLYLAAFPQLMSEFGSTASTVQLTLTAFLLGIAGGQLVFGPLSDRFGRLRPLLIGSAVCVLASAATVFAPTIEVLIGARLVQGLAGAAGMVIGRAIIADLAVGRTAARAMSLMMIVGGVAPVAAPLIGGLLVGPLGWRGVLAVVWGIVIVMLVSVLVVVRETHGPERRAELRARRVEAGSPWRDLLSRRYIGSVIAMCCGFAAMMAYISASPFLYQEMMGLSPAVYGVMFGVNACAIMLASSISARLVMTVQPYVLVRVGLAILLASSLVLLALSVSGAPDWTLALPMIPAVGSMGLVLGNATALAIGAARRSAGTASAVVGSSQFLLAAIVSPLVGIAGEDTAVPMAIAMVVAALLAWAGALVAGRPQY